MVNNVSVRIGRKKTSTACSFQTVTHAHNICGRHPPYVWVVTSWVICNCTFTERPNRTSWEVKIQHFRIGRNSDGHTFHGRSINVQWTFCGRASYTSYVWNRRTGATNVFRHGGALFHWHLPIIYMHLSMQLIVGINMLILKEMNKHKMNSSEINFKKRYVV